MQCVCIVGMHVYYTHVWVVYITCMHIEMLKTSSIKSPVPSNIEIAQSISPVPIRELIQKLGLNEDNVDVFGRNKAKVHYFENNDAPRGKYVVVAGMTPTSFGEGKSTACIGISQALGAHLNKRVFTCIRQPSMGPTFGIKGGAAGGGYSQVVPMDEFNLHLTGDIHAVSIANNLLCAQIDTRIYHEKTCSTDRLFEKLFPQEGTKEAKDGSFRVSEIMKSRIIKCGLDPAKISEWSFLERERVVRLNIDPSTIMVNRVVDVNDRMLRGIQIGLGPAEGGKYVRNSQVDIAVSCEIMAILALVSNLKDLHTRLGSMVVAMDTTGTPITVNDLGVTGALTVLLKDALNPTLMQTIEQTPVFVHTGPFANIAHGNSSIIAVKMALSLVGEAGYVLTECGFGSDMGLEKFMNIKCTQSQNLRPDCIVIVATCRALKMHGNGCLEAGMCNLEAHINIGKQFGSSIVVCVNKHVLDSKDELQFVINACMKSGADFAGIGDHYAQGGRGAIDVANMIIQACNRPSEYKPLYIPELSLSEKIISVCVKIYGANGVAFSQTAKTQLELFEKLGYGKFSVCMAKTQYSLSHDPTLIGRPTGFTVPVNECHASVGAKFIYCLVGPIMTMPGLPIRPAFYDIDIDTKTGRVTGMF